MKTQHSNKSYFRFPFILLHVINEVRQYLTLSGVEEFLDLPKNAEIKVTGNATDKVWIEKVVIYYAGGFRIKAEVQRSVGIYGGEYEIVGLTLRWRSGYELKEKIENLLRWSGPPREIKDYQEGMQMSFTDEGLKSMQYSSTLRRNGHPVYMWDDSAHPRHMYG